MIPNAIGVRQNTENEQASPVHKFLSQEVITWELWYMEAGDFYGGVEDKVLKR